MEGNEGSEGDDTVGQRIQVTATLVQHVYAAIFPQGEMSDVLGWGDGQGDETGDGQDEDAAVGEHESLEGLEGAEDVA